MVLIKREKEWIMFQDKRREIKMEEKSLKLILILQVLVIVIILTRFDLDGIETQV